MKLPAQFVASLEANLGADEARALCEALDTPPTTSIRFNPYKVTRRPEGRQVPWCRYGYLLDERPQFTLDPLFHGGAYYVQEASSMFVEHIYRSVMPDEGAVRVLDLCAAPGGKTTLLSTLAGLESTVVANEVIRPRAMTLADNVRKWGLGNVVVTNNDPAHFEGFKDYFDFILVDAPCSGEGMFRRVPESRGEWSADNVNLCAQRQRRILSDIWGALKPGGVLVYSTCTFNRAENEDNVAWLASEYDVEAAEVAVDPAWGVVKGGVESDGGQINTFRFYPHKVDGEGFFAAVLRKAEGKARTKTPKPRRQIFSELQKPVVRELAGWVMQPEFMHFAQAGENIYGYYAAAYDDVKTLSQTLSVVYSGVMMGQIFKGRLKPEHPLALFHDLRCDAAAQSSLELDDALNYLRKQDIAPQLLTAEGINLVSFDGLPIGWIKRIGNNRSNNMYPKELRIQNL